MAVFAGMTNQFTAYYRHGTYDDCPAKLAYWKNCLKMKLSSVEVREQMEHTEWRDSVKDYGGAHIFTFRPAYQTEAYHRYGVKSR